MSDKIALRAPDVEHLREAAHMLGRWAEYTPNAAGQVTFDQAMMRAVENDLISAFYPLRELCAHAIDEQGGCCRTCGAHVEDIGAPE